MIIIKQNNFQGFVMLKWKKQRFKSCARAMQKKSLRKSLRKVCKNFAFIERAEKKSERRRSGNINAVALILSYTLLKRSNLEGKRRVVWNAKRCHFSRRLPLPVLYSRRLMKIFLRGSPQTFDSLNPVTLWTSSVISPLDSNFIISRLAQHAATFRAGSS